MARAKAISVPNPSENKAACSVKDLANSRDFGVPGYIPGMCLAFPEAKPATSGPGMGSAHGQDETHLLPFSLLQRCLRGSLV